MEAFRHQLRVARRRELFVGLGARLLLGAAVVAANALVFVLVFWLQIPALLSFFVTFTIAALAWVAGWKLSRSGWRLR